MFKGKSRLATITASLFFVSIPLFTFYYKQNITYFDALTLLRIVLSIF